MIRIPAQQSRWPAHLLARRGWKWLRSGLPHCGRRLHAQYILQIEFRYPGPKLPINPITCISDDYSTRDVLLHGIPDLIQRYLRLRVECNVFGDPGRIPLFLVTGPNLRQVQPICEGKTRSPGRHRQTHRDTTIVLLADLSAILSRDTHRMTAFLLVAAGEGAILADRSGPDR
jgi:hypothetical protein